MKLVPDMVPESSWFTNLRSEMSKAEWDAVRKEVSRRAGGKCEVCGGRGPKWQVECHERWDYDEKKGKQRLSGLQALCPACHEVNHIGLAQVRGRFKQALGHMCRVNGCSEAKAEEDVEKAFSTWRRRSLMDWKLDLSWMDDFWRKT